MNKIIKIIHFSGRKCFGNCSHISEYISTQYSGITEIIKFSELKIESCGSCEYECFKNIGCVHNDDMSFLYGKILEADKLVFIIPLYNGFAPSHYMKFKERQQAYLRDDDFRSVRNKKRKFIILGNRSSGVEHLYNWLLIEENLSDNDILIIESTAFRMSSIRDNLIENNEVKKLINSFLHELLSPILSTGSVKHE